MQSRHNNSKAQMSDININDCYELVMKLVDQAGEVCQN